jgi:superfamily II DNA/RNA helicase
VADLMSNYLNINKLKSTTINGLANFSIFNLIFSNHFSSDRPQKLREESLNHFRTGKYNIVVTTDVCARGIDIKDLHHVNY